MTLESKYGVPVAARVDVQTAHRLRTEALERNTSVSKRLAELIDRALHNESNIERLNRSRQRALANRVVAERKLEQLKTNIVTWLFERGATQEDVETAIEQINQAGSDD